MSKRQHVSFFLLFTLLMTLSLFFAAYGLWLSAVGMVVAAFGVLWLYAVENRENRDI